MVLAKKNFGDFWPKIVHELSSDIFLKKHSSLLPRKTGHNQTDKLQCKYTNSVLRRVPTILRGTVVCITVAKK